MSELSHILTELGLSPTDALLLTMTDRLAELKDLLSKNCKIQKIQPAVFASDAEVSIVVVTVLCPDGATHVIKAYREEAQAIRELIRTKT